MNFSWDSIFLCRSIVVTIPSITNSFNDLKVLCIASVLFLPLHINLHIKPSEENVRLDLISKNQDGRGMEVQSVLFNGKEIPYSHSNNELNISEKRLKFTYCFNQSYKDVDVCRMICDRI